MERNALGSRGCSVWERLSGTHSLHIGQFERTSQLSWRTWPQDKEKSVTLFVHHLVTRLNLVHCRTAMSGRVGKSRVG